MKKIILLLCMMCGVSVAQPVIFGWRPPTGCTTGQAITWSGSVWQCGTSGISGTLTGGRSVRATGASTVSTGSFADDGAADVRELKSSSVATLTVGDDITLTTNGQSGWKAQAYSDGNIYIDTKVNASGHTYWRMGAGAESGANKTLFDIQNSGGGTTANFAWLFTGDTTFGSSSGNVMDVNGSLTKFGNSSDGKFYIYEDEIDFAYALNSAATGYINFSGYNHGATQFRDLDIRDGKGAQVALFAGSTKTTTLNGYTLVKGNPGVPGNDGVHIGFSAPTGYIGSKNSSGSPASNLVLQTTTNGGTTSTAITIDNFQTTTFSGNVISTAGVNTLGELRGNTVTPATFGTNQNDYAGCTSAALYCRVTPTANVDLTGFTGGAAGRVLIVQNVDAVGFQVTFRHESASSTTAADRLSLPDAVDSWPLQQYGTAVFVYDGTANRWRLASWSNDVHPKVTVTSSFTAGNTATMTIGSNGFTTSGPIVLNSTLTANGTSGATGQVLTIVGGSPKWSNVGTSLTNGTHTEWFDDYIQGSGTPMSTVGIPMQGAWEFGSGGTCTQTWTASTPPLHGILRLQPNTTGGVCFAGAEGASHEMITTASNTVWTFELGVDFNELADNVSGRDYTAIFGIAETPTVLDQSNGCYFAYDDRNHLTGAIGSLNAAKWECWCANGGTRTKYVMDGTTVSDGSFTTVNSTIALKVQDHLKLVYTSTTGSSPLAEFYINGTKRCQINTNTPASASVLGPIFRSVNSSATSSTSYLELDWSKLIVDSSTSRN
jgi:hypothetical protein